MSNYDLIVVGSGAADTNSAIIINLFIFSSYCVLDSFLLLGKLMHYILGMCTVCELEMGL